MRVAMIVRVVVAMMMAMTLRRRIGPAFRFEWRFDYCHFRTERNEQGFCRSVALRADAVGQKLGLDVTVAKMPSETRERRNIDRACFNQRLGRGHDFHQIAIVENEKIIGAQPDRPA